MSTLVGMYNGKQIMINNYDKNMAQKVVCNYCNTQLVAKRGTVVMHYFAHKTKQV